MDGLAVIEGGNMYHFKECGLDNIWLCNGFEFKETARGLLVKINDLDGLHSAIAKWIVTSPNKIRGQEVRFLRSMLGVSQHGLGKLLRQSRPSVARWEAMPDKAIPTQSDSWLRVIYTKKIEGDIAVGRIIDLLTEMDEIAHAKRVRQEAKFLDDARGWKAAA
jgi:DNA-binding transcriptional regulator YiaG